MKQTILIFAALSTAILILFELSKISIFSYESPNEVFVVIAGSSFILIGFLISRLFSKKQHNEKNGTLNQSSLSKQEYRVFLLMNDGLSNIQIAEQLFIAESTVKTHVSRILTKLNAKRRTEAIKIGRDKNFI